MSIFKPILHSSTTEYNVQRVKKFFYLIICTNCGIRIILLEMIFKIIIESFRQAFQALRSNVLRTFLSLLGIMIGIFCIVVVMSAVDSFEASIKSGFSELGSDVIYLDKMPWDEDPGQNYWKYAKRPDPSLDDYEAILKRSKLADAVSYATFTFSKTVKFKSNSVSGVFVMGVTDSYKDKQELSFEKGRYFSTLESLNGNNTVILGHKVAKELFPKLEPIGKSVSLLGQKYTVIGVMEAEGDNMFNFIDFDEVAMVSLTNFRRYFNLRDSRSVGESLAIKAKPNVEIEDLKDEVTGIIRASRRLKPTEEEDFVLNEISMLSQIIENIFSVINIAGLLIGIFALIVGMFSVANIMFVSVRERTGIIGVKKALGAKNPVILFEFLLEAVVLCILGGAIGIFFVYLILTGISAVLPLELFLTAENALIGIIASVAVGIISGIVPAFLAARMDPVEAIRH